MAFNRDDPHPFLPHGFHHIEVHGRQLMARAATRPKQRHEDWTIVTINPYPDHLVMFAPTHDIIREFLVDNRGIRIRDIQRSHLGQALVRFDWVIDRDHFVHNSPHPFGDVEISFRRHKEGINFRALNFNRECWLLLLGFPLDYWEHEYIESAIASFGRLTFWEEDRRHMTRVLIKARVTELEDIPQFIVFIDSEGFQGLS